MGIYDRDYMRERHKPGAKPRARNEFDGLWSTGTRSNEAWSLPKWIVTCAAVLALVFFASRHFVERSRAKPFPATGDVHWYTQLTQPGTAQLTLVAPRNSERNFAVRLDDWEPRTAVALIPVRSGEVSVSMIPLGRYRLTIASGKTWQGTERLFGSETTLRQAVHPVEFFQRESGITSQRIELEVPFKGNMETMPARL